MRDTARARGALLGLAVGDALGTTLEFRALAAPPFPTLVTGPHRAMRGGGPFRVAKGQVTDDTQMAVSLARSLAARGAYDAADVARRYADWREPAFDIGTQTAAALEKVALGTSPAESGVLVWIQSGRRAAGNGSLMRTAPIGVFFTGDPGARRAAALADSLITHADPRCVLACAALNASIARAAGGGPPLPAREILDAAREELEPAAAALEERLPAEREPIETARTALEEDLSLAAQDDPRLYGPAVHIHEHQGFVRVAFRLAYWELLHAPSFEAALVDVVNRGGDADTNAAITGALLGAVYGESAIPSAWTEAVLGALALEPGPWRDLYHPRFFLEWLAAG